MTTRTSSADDDQPTLFAPPPCGRYEPDDSSGASFSADGCYRYSLARSWDLTVGQLGFIMCNPSTADAAVDDPTIRRCVSFARSEGYGGINVTNLFAFRATNPKDLVAAWRDGTDIIGPENGAYIRRFVVHPTNTHIAAWGALSALRSTKRGRACTDRHIAEVKDRFGGRLMRLDDGRNSPAPHPLYLRRDAAIIPMRTS